MVHLSMTDLEATELEYAIKYFLNSLLSPSTGCHKCMSGGCVQHYDMTAILKFVLRRLQETGFNLQS